MVLTQRSSAVKGEKLAIVGAGEMRVEENYERWPKCSCGAFRNKPVDLIKALYAR
jgi:hypothetical protein